MMTQAASVSGRSFAGLVDLSRGKDHGFNDQTHRPGGSMRLPAIA